MRPLFQEIALSLAALYVSFCFITSKFTNDVAIFMGVENIADKFYPFPHGIDIAWEAKPIGNRIINYVILKAAELFVPFEDPANFAMVAKAIVLLALFLLAAYIAYVLGGRYTFWIIFFAFTTVCNFCIMQSEWWAVLLSLTAMACLMHDNEYAPYVAGFIFVFVGMIKGITALLFIPVLCGVYLLGEPQQNANVKVLYGVLATGVLVVTAQLTVWKNMLPDLLLTPAIAGVGRNTAVDQVLIFTGQNVLSAFYIPITIIGVAATAMLVASGYFKEARTKVLFAVMWLVPAVMVFIHSEFFAYQFMLYMLPSLVTIIIGFRCVESRGCVPPSRKRVVVQNVGFVVAILLVVVFIPLNSNIGIMTKVEADFFSQQTGYIDQLKATYPIQDEESVLYLDAGVAPYYFGANSTSRYISPLPFQRDGPDWNLTDNYAFRQTYADAMAYYGEYIVGDGSLIGGDDWLHFAYPNRNQLAAKLANDYEIVWTKGWVIYKRKQVNCSA